MNLKSKFALLLILVVALTAALGVLSARWFDSALLRWILIVAIALLPVLWMASRTVRPIEQMLRALSGTVAAPEGDSACPRSPRRRTGELMMAHNNWRRARQRTWCSASCFWIQ